MIPFPKFWQLRSTRLSFTRPFVVGILNVTPDSFSDGGLFLDPAKALERAAQIREEGADLLEIGGESTRPGSIPVDPDEEWRRIHPLLAVLARDGGIPISVDTRNSLTAKRALEFGVEAINDVGCGRDPLLLRELAASGAGYVLMHSRGNPGGMMDLAAYTDPVREVMEEWTGARERALESGISSERICLDPGFGFAKLPEHNVRILEGLESLAALSHPLMVGFSRKRMLRELTGTDPEALKAAGLAAAFLALAKGANLIRTHEVKATVAALRALQMLTAEVKMST